MKKKFVLLQNKNWLSEIDLNQPVKVQLQKAASFIITKFLFIKNHAKLSGSSYKIVYLPHKIEGKHHHSLKLPDSIELSSGDVNLPTLNNPCLHFVLTMQSLGQINNEKCKSTIMSNTPVFKLLFTTGNLRIFHLSFPTDGRATLFCSNSPATLITMSASDYMILLHKGCSLSAQLEKTNMNIEKLYMGIISANEIKFNIILKYTIPQYYDSTELNQIFIITSVCFSAFLIIFILVTVGYICKTRVSISEDTDIYMDMTQTHEPTDEENGFSEKTNISKCKGCSDFTNNPVTYKSEPNRWTTIPLRQNKDLGTTLPTSYKSYKI